MPYLLTQNEVASLLSVSVYTVKRLRQSGQLPTTLVGRSVRVPDNAVREYIERETWQRDYRHGLKLQKTANTTLSTQQMDAAKERAYGQQIYLWQKNVSQDG